MKNSCTLFREIRQLVVCKLAQVARNHMHVKHSSIYMKLTSSVQLACKGQRLLLNVVQDPGGRHPPTFSTAYHNIGGEHTILVAPSPFLVERSHN